jgi:phosphatidylglycerophosphate synthase
VHKAARVAVRPLVNTGVAPNHLTTLRLATGVAAAAAFAVGTRRWDIVAGWIFVFSAFLDRADGELARISGRTSRTGHVYDLASDVASNVMAFAGIGIGLSHGALGATALALGLIAAIAVGAIFALVTLMDGGTGEAFPGAAGFDPDDALFILGPAAWLGLLQPLLYAAAVGAPLFLVFALWQYRQERRKRYNRAP